MYASLSLKLNDDITLQNGGDIIIPFFMCVVIAVFLLHINLFEVDAHGVYNVYDWVTLDKMLRLSSWHNGPALFHSPYIPLYILHIVYVYMYFPCCCSA